MTTILRTTFENCIPKYFYLKLWVVYFLVSDYIIEPINGSKPPIEIVCPFLFVCILFIYFSALRTREESFSGGENAFYVLRENITFVYYFLEKKTLLRWNDAKIMLFTFTLWKPSNFYQINRYQTCTLKLLGLFFWWKDIFVFEIYNQVW